MGSIPGSRRSPGREDPLEEGMATHSSILAWRIPWTEEPAGLQSIGLPRVGQNWSNLAQNNCSPNSRMTVSLLTRVTPAVLTKPKFQCLKTIMWLFLAHTITQWSVPHKQGVFLLVPLCPKVTWSSASRRRVGGRRTTGGIIMSQSWNWDMCLSQHPSSLTGTGKCSS